MTTITITRPALNATADGETILAVIIRMLKGRNRNMLSGRQLSRLNERMLLDLGISKR